MMPPWDGVWTEELLRDLTSGATRQTGEVRVHNIAGDVRVRRDNAHWPTVYLIDGSAGVWFEPWRAVQAMNESEAVPINEDGTWWKVTLPEDW